MIALPIYLQMVLEYNAMLAGSPSPRSLSMFGVALLAGKRVEGDARSAIIHGSCSSPPGCCS